MVVSETGIPVFRTGESLVADTAIVATSLAIVVVLALSVTEMVAVLLVVFGASFPLKYWTAFRAFCHCIVVAVLPAELKVMTPVLALYEPVILPIVPEFTNVKLSSEAIKLLVIAMVAELNVAVGLKLSIRFKPLSTATDAPLAELLLGSI